MAGTPYKRAGRHCGAYARSTGLPCRCIKVRFCPTSGNWRCKFHGGASINLRARERITRKTGREFLKRGPKTPEGIAASYSARDAGRDRYFAQRRISRLASP